jgi:hypothetical protein
MASPLHRTRAQNIFCFCFQKADFVYFSPERTTKSFTVLREGGGGKIGRKLFGNWIADEKRKRP